MPLLCSTNCLQSMVKLWGSPLHSAIARSSHTCSASPPTASAHSYLPPLFSVAPMMDWTDHHFRTLARLLSSHAWLYTEMISADSLLHHQPHLVSLFSFISSLVILFPLILFFTFPLFLPISQDRFLAFSPHQRPIVLQLGGSNVRSLAKAAQLSTPYGYDEINLNCGCPSPRVAGHGCFGVSLMLNPQLVGEAMSAIAANTNVPVSVKCRIGVDEHDSYDELCDFVYKVSTQSLTSHFIIHSRKALLSGISPADNRRIPPLKYEYYYALVRDFPSLKFTINGGITCVSEVNAALREGAHGVMVGRAAYNNPWQILGHVDTAVYGVPSSGLTRRQVLEQYQVYGDSVIGSHGNGRPNVRDVVKPLLNLFHSEAGNNLWKRRADSAFRKCWTVESFLEETLTAIPDSVLDSPICEVRSGREDIFANVHKLMPPPFEPREQLILCA